MSKYSSNFNKETVKKLSLHFAPGGIVLIQEEVSKNWDECLNGEVCLPRMVCIKSSTLAIWCTDPDVAKFLNSVTHVNFEFKPQYDMEQIPKLEKAPIGVWIKASDVANYDFSDLNCADVLLRKPHDYYGSDEKRLNVTMDYTRYTVGFLYEDAICISANDEENIPLDSCDYDIMVIKLDTNK